MEGAVTGPTGLSAVIRAAGASLVGEDPRAVEKLSQRLRKSANQVVGGTTNMAIAAIENALIDVKAKALGIPVAELFGGPIRTRLPVYWTQCGNWRVDRGWSYDGAPKDNLRLHTYEDVVALGREAADAGFTSAKSMIFTGLDGERSSGLWNPGTGEPADDALVHNIVQTQMAFREGAGEDFMLKLDLNFNFKSEGLIKIAKALEPARMDWLEMDLHDPEALAKVREQSPAPIASLESLYGRQQFLPYLQANAVDVAIIDCLWNGALESMKMASLCDVYSVNCAAHNFGAHLGTAISAHVLASIPNFRVLEYQPECVPWRDDVSWIYHSLAACALPFDSVCYHVQLFTVTPTIVDGELDMEALMRRPGWGIDVNEEAVAAHPSRRPEWHDGGSGFAGKL